MTIVKFQSRKLTCTEDWVFHTIPFVISLPLWYEKYMPSKIDINKETLIKLVNVGMTCREIALKLKVTMPTVRSKFRNLGLVELLEVNGRNRQHEKRYKDGRAIIVKSVELKGLV